MILYPAIDLIGGEAVRLVRGDYDQKTVYSRHPLEVAQNFAKAGAVWLHTVDLEGAREGGAPNYETIADLIAHSGLRVEVGGGIRDEAVMERYLRAGAARVILGTAAVTDPAFLRSAVRRFGSAVAVGADLRGGMVAIHGWTQTAALTAQEFFARLQEEGVSTVICTDISKDGLLAGTNRALYRQLSLEFPRLKFIASGGVSSLEDIRQLRTDGVAGAILGKALYTGALDLREAVAEAGDQSQEEAP